jgi:crossover junction endodeoxyribonuclease RuvC
MTPSVAQLPAGTPLAAGAQVPATAAPLPSSLLSLGVDGSATATGFVVLEGSAASKLPTLRHEEVVRVASCGLQRCSDIAGRLLEVLDRFAPERVAIEGYGFANKHSLVTLVEVGTVLRYFLRQKGYRYLEPSPNALKKFVLGTGQGRKDQMLLQVFKRWGHEARDDNTADAYGLACIGLVHAGRLRGPTRAMLDVVGGLKMR